MGRRSSETVKLEWRVGEKPTGRYRSFHKRSWPSASYKATGDHAGSIYAVDGSSYDPRAAEDTLLRVTVAYRTKELYPRFENRRLVGTFKGVKAAKAALQSFIDRYPHLALPYGDMRKMTR